MTHPEHLAELKEAAEAALNAGDLYEFDEKLKETTINIGAHSAKLSFDAKATPATVLALLQQNAELRATVEAKDGAIVNHSGEIMRLRAQLAEAQAAKERAAKVIEPFAAVGALLGKNESGEVLGILGANDYASFTRADLRAAADWKTESGEG